MKVVYSWLRDFVEVTLKPADLASRLALSGTNVRGVEVEPLGGVIDLEVSSNRPDGLGVYGIAREVAALYRLPLKAVSPKLREAAAKAGDAAYVKIAAPELCGRFTARVIRNVKVAPSPSWLAERLKAVGVASINNVVDVTNYVMLELGHALHAFDYDLVRDHAIVVRGARPGEKIRTLDGVERELAPGICVISDGDGSRAVGIGGIMGGGETEISFSTRNVLLECAWFEPVAIRRATRHLKLHTEASTRFSRGADPEMAELASRRCAELLCELAGGELLSGVIDAYPGKRVAKKITLTRAEILRVMGADIPDRDSEEILRALGFAPVRADQNRGQAGSILAAWECTQPSWRADVEREIDLIEEVARVYGLDKFPPRLPAARQGAARLPYYEAAERVRERLIGLGYREILTISQVSEDRDALFRPAGAVPARLTNPLSEEAALLRSTGAVSVAGAIEWNLNHGQRNLRLFEMGQHYRFSAGEAGAQPVETAFLTMAATGEARPQGLYDEARDFEFSDLKGDLDAVGALSGGFRWQEGGADSLHPAKRGRLFLGDHELGSGGLLARRIADKLKFRQQVFLAELALGPFYCRYYGTKNARRYVPLPRFPAVERDFSLLLPDGVTFAEVAAVIRSLGIPAIASIEAVDLYRGRNVPPGQYSLMVRVTFESREATFTDVQVSEFCSQIVAALASRLAAALRAG